MNDITFCSVLFCPLETLCKRKSYLGKPYDEDRSFLDFSGSLKQDENGEFCCEDGIEVACK